MMFKIGDLVRIKENLSIDSSYHSEIRGKIGKVIKFHTHPLCEVAIVDFNIPGRSADLVFVENLTLQEITDWKTIIEGNK